MQCVIVPFYDGIALGQQFDEGRSIENAVPIYQYRVGSRVCLDHTSGVAMGDESVNQPHRGAVRDE
jgi:hypothetical protein